MTNENVPLELVTVPCLSDNYAFLVHNSVTGDTALIDAPEAAPIKAVLDAKGWALTDILITHHHYDHIDGVAELRDGARVIGAAADAHRLPPLDMSVNEGDIIQVCGVDTHVLDVSGHTVGHIAYYMPGPKFVFTADSLMALGCGRLFEGTPEQMWQSMQKLRALPPETMVCSGHEYTQSNARFALSIDPGNAELILRSAAIDKARSAGLATVPSILADEIRTNPFLRADDPAFKAALGLSDLSDVQMFAEIRARKDKF
ncbi:hydroxyacylglutathione hydrolase [Yoonia sediminilitoris]|uniref:Hydroxyacylglutathione hydrolase n=1 Tax=Yoonia sediminilitoris TaxID=1286148 RepID=A0A2T6K8H9_9RHOB|nr:hydroxyacylglutathione hydrolase [Yoonia sediminilitoris]PUB11051.1 hydroxyacylglutathione hydrolase [Yoonia sediminilitoris]RCW90970.1 hydroxyacylglutathione hydrolase [Yoonia sediminilitoris]